LKPVLSANTALEFAVEKLAAFLDARFGAASLALERVGGGQSNPTFRVGHGARCMEFRIEPAGEVLPGAHAIDREFRIFKALEGTGVPVPKALLFSDDSHFVGTPLYLMERLDCVCSTTARWKISLRRNGSRSISPWPMPWPSCMRSTPTRSDSATTAGRAKVFLRQIARWSRQYEELPGDRIPALDRVIDWPSAMRTAREKGR